MKRWTARRLPAGGQSSTRGAIQSLVLAPSVKLLTLPICVIRGNITSVAAVIGIVWPARTSPRGAHVFVTEVDFSKQLCARRHCRADLLIAELANL